MSWARKILRVNLTTGDCSSEPLNMEWAAQYLGQRGLGTKYLVEETDPTVDPFSPDNKLIIATGPLTGTIASTAGRWSVITKSPLTGAIACSNSGGFFGAELKTAGWDMIIFEGKSPKPVYLFIKDDNCELLPADDLWGTSVWHTEPAIKEKHGDDKIKVASIGEAGENGVLFAAVVNDLDRAAGRSGVGAVMGSKNLKAIAARGTKGVQVNDPRAFMQSTMAAKKVLAEHTVTGEGLPTYGTQVLMNIINESGALPTENARDGQFEGAEKISGEAMHETTADGHKNLVSNNACFACTIGCARVSKINPKHVSVKDRPEYQKESGGLEYEAAWAMGASTKVDDLDALTFANFLCNEHGMDPISFGSTVAAAMELYDVGAITEEQVGYPLTFGSADALMKIAEQTGKGEGFGVEIGMGSKRLCEKYGHPEFSMTVKGQEFPAYDPRGVQGMGLAYATSNRGGCHLRGYTVSSEVLGLPVKTDPHVTEGKAELAKAFQDLTAMIDSSGLCIFTSFALGLDDYQPQIQAACEGDFSGEKLLEIGERIWNIERKYNLAAGLTGKDDTLPKRLLKDAIKSGPTKGMVNRLDEMLPEYYKLRGWSEDGEPTAATLGRLNLV
ncbi:MAG: aldehyde ferredoxin oxidoreductase family protein [Myxococcales bacterium]|nr:aldehyde ferredoxin oxidoreductase family protein [Myxococcales bacterium]